MRGPSRPSARRGPPGRAPARRRRSSRGRASVRSRRCRARARRSGPGSAPRRRSRRSGGENSITRLREPAGSDAALAERPAVRCRCPPAPQPRPESLTRTIPPIRTSTKVAAIVTPGEAAKAASELVRFAATQRATAAHRRLRIREAPVAAGARGAPRRGCPAAARRCARPGPRRSCAAEAARARTTRASSRPTGRGRRARPLARSRGRR